MPLSGLDSVLAGYKQRIVFTKTNSAATVAGLPYTLIDRAGAPAAGSLNPGNATNGIVPTDATTGFPTIQAYAGSNRGYISRIELSCSAACTIELYDVLFMAGQTTIPTTGTTTVSLTSIPSFATRVPFRSDGTTRDYSLVELFLLASTALSNHAHTASIDYTDSADGAQNTGNMATQNIPVNRMIRMPLATALPVKTVTGYKLNGATSSTGSVSVMAARKLCSIRALGFSAVLGPDQTGLPEVYADSALMPVVIMDSTSSALPYLNIEIVEVACANDFVRKVAVVALRLWRRA
jgi:hypothetical protein